MRIDTQEKINSYFKSITEQCKSITPLIEELDTFVSGLKLALNSSVYFKTYWYPSNSSVYSIVVGDVPIEMVVDLLLGPIHRQFGVNWTVEPKTYGFYYTTVWRGIRISIEVQESSISGACEIRKVIVGEKSPKEIEELKYEYKYYVVCNEED